MGFQDVTSLPTRARVPSHSRSNCGGGGKSATITCLITVVGGNRGHAPCNICLLHLYLFVCQLNFVEIIRLS